MTMISNANASRVPETNHARARLSGAKATLA